MATTSKATSYSITTRGGRIYAATPFSRTFIAEAKRLAGARWHANDKEWSFPVYQQQAVSKLCSDVFGGGSTSNAPSAPTIGDSDRMFGLPAGKNDAGTYETLRTIFEGATASRDMMVMGILSDAQEAMMSGDIEGARQMINRAKWGIAEYLTTKTASPAPTVRQAIAIVRDAPMNLDRDHHAAEVNALNDEARGELAAASEPEDFDPEMGF